MSSSTPQSQTAAGPSSAPSQATDSLFVTSAPVPDHFQPIRGPNFEQVQDVNNLIDSFATIGFQASGVHKAVQIIEKMVSLPRTSLLTPTAPFSDHFALLSHSANGDYPMNLFNQTNPKTNMTRTSAPKPNVTSSSASHPTSSPLVYAKFSFFSSNTSTSLQLSQQPEESKRTSSNVSARRISLISIWTEASSERRE